MRKISKKRVLISFFCLSFLLTGNVVLAGSYSRSLTYKFTHYIPSQAVYVGNDGTVNLKLTTTTWGDDSFWVEQCISGMFSSTYITKRYFKKSDGNTQTKTFDQKDGEHYVFNFWKKDNSNYIVGSGTISF